MKRIGFGIAIAWPVAYLLLTSWLADFAYRIDLGPQPFIVSGALAILICTLTVGAKAWRASGANPVDSLRQE